jgi:uncharacterized protein YfkK (UPF0435 family)
MDNFEKSLQCPICLDYCKEAIECTLCHNLFCNECIKSIGNSNCALCQNETKYQDSHFARRLISEIKVKCDYCQQDSTIGELNKHKERCLEVMLKCTVCDELIKKLEYLDHLKLNHLIQISDKLNIINNAIVENNNLDLVSISNSHSIDKQINEFSRLARLGKTGKYYCSGRLDGLKCNCCDGYCGPSTGCNCSGCMKLDIKYRGLSKGWLVNREGFVSKKSPETELFYCGRKVMPIDHHCDGFCGPNNGPNCKACTILDIQAKSRYSRFV